MKVALRRLFFNVYRLNQLCYNVRKLKNSLNFLEEFRIVDVISKRIQASKTATWPIKEKIKVY